jgi:Effector protein
MGVTTDELRRELDKLGKKELEINALLYPDPKPTKLFPNILIGFLDLKIWLDQQPAPRQKPLRAALGRFALAQVQYRNDVLEQLGLIGKQKTGKAVLAEITSAKSLHLTITPFHSDSADVTNAEAVGDKDEDATPLGFEVRNEDGIKLPGTGLGTGTGTSSTVDYTPGMWGPSGTAHAQGPGSLADEILCHELVHAGRQMKGIQHNRKVSDFYQNEEEYVAVVVTNIYMSEKKQTKLRASHFSEPIKKGDKIVGKKYQVLADAAHFLDNPQNVTPPPYQLMEKIRLRQGSLWNALLDIGPALAAFNPARDWEPRRAKVFIDI